MQDESSASGRLPQSSLGEFEPGSVAFDNYLIIGKLGEGGMGAVYKATNILLDRTSALKVLPVDTFSSKEVVRFQNEARLLSKLEHANIAQVYDFGIGEGNRPYISMEYIEGDTLQDSVDKNGPLPLDLFFEVFIQVSKGLSHAHKKGVIHRDVKTSNLMLAKDEEESLRAVLLDFGVAKMSSDNESGRLTRPGAMIGSPLYMSPEQAVGDSASAASDIYSLSCVMFFALTGKPPFQADTVLNTLSMHRDAALSIEKLEAVPGMTKELCALIATGLSKSPSDRQSSASEITEKLIELSEKLQDTESGAGSVRVTEPSPAAGKLRTLLLGSVAVTAVALLSGLYFGLSSLLIKNAEVEALPRLTLHVSPGADLDGEKNVSLENNPFSKVIDKTWEGGKLPKIIDTRTSKDRVDLKEADRAKRKQNVSNTDLQTALSTYKRILENRGPAKPPDEITTRCLLGIYEIDQRIGIYSELAKLEKEILKYCPDGDWAAICFTSFEKTATELSNKHKSKEAQRCHQSAAELLKKVKSPDAIENAKLEMRVGATYRDSQDLSKCKLWLERARVHFAKFAPASEQRFDLVLQLAQLYDNLGEFKKAEQRYREAETVWIQMGNHSPSESAGYLYAGWATLLYHQGQTEEAKKKILKGLSYNARETRPVMLNLLEMIRKKTAPQSQVHQGVLQ